MRILEFVTCFECNSSTDPLLDNLTVANGNALFTLEAEVSSLRELLFLATHQDRDILTLQLAIWQAYNYPSISQRYATTS